MTQVKCVSTHAEDLADGRQLAPGEEANVDLTEPHNSALAEDGKLLVLGDPPTKDDLLKKAKALGADANKSMNIDQIQEVIADAEAAKAAEEAEEAAKQETGGDQT